MLPCDRWWWCFAGLVGVFVVQRGAAFYDLNFFINSTWIAFYLKNARRRPQAKDPKRRKREILYLETFGCGRIRVHFLLLTIFARLGAGLNVSSVNFHVVLEKTGFLLAFCFPNILFVINFFLFSVVVSFFIRLLAFVFIMSWEKRTRKKSAWKKSSEIIARD